MIKFNLTYPLEDDIILRPYATTFANYYVEICSILFLHFVLCIGYPFIKQKKDMSPCLLFHNCIWKFSVFDQFSKQMKE